MMPLRIIENHDAEQNFTKDGEALYSQQKQDWGLTVAQIMNSLIFKFCVVLNRHNNNKCIQNSRTGKIFNYLDHFILFIME